MLGIIVMLPFFVHHYGGYRQFCTSSGGRPTWCEDAVPSIYGHVQSKYWNVGLFQYWTFAQLPNIALAMPVLGLLATYSIRHLHHTLAGMRSLCLGGLAPESVRPHAIHTCVFTAVLVCASHTQMGLRAVSGLPTTYWAGGWLVMSGRGRIFMLWTTVWYMVSIVLWAVFLPPA